jgi:predicted MPP superfamily phosphohydrolase
MKIRPVSDIHTEFYGEDEMEALALAVLPPLPDDKGTILILAGDIGSMHKPYNISAFMDFVAPRFREVFYIAGNHEYYCGSLDETPFSIRDLVKHQKNVRFTTGEIYSRYEGEGEDVKVETRKRFHLTTMWTDFDGENLNSMQEAQMRMNDYRLIRVRDRVAIPEDMLAMHKEAVRHLAYSISPGDVVVTHHSPSLQSIPKEYLTDRVNGAYHSDLDSLIMEKKPAIWIHGHTHTATQYNIGGTRIICNPRGYGNQYRKNGYNPTLVVEV